MYTVEDSMTWEEIRAYCDSNREADGFCRICSACSGPGVSNYGPDYEEGHEPGLTLLRGGNYGSCFFVERKS